MVVLVSIADRLQQAFAALLRGDTDERNRLCGLAEKELLHEEMEEKAAATARVLTVDFYVKADGTVIETRKMYAAAN
jgi:hypothetical protein